MVDGRRLATAVLCLLLSIVTLPAQNKADLFPPKPDPAVFVHDYAGWLSAGQRNALEQRLRAYNDSTSTQIVVMIRNEIGDYDKASYAFELGRRWGVGTKEKDNGVLMLIKPEPPERGIFIATGYGAEGALPDILAGRIVRNTMAPYFRQQQYYEGISAGLDDIISALKGEFKADPKGNNDADAGAFLFVLLFMLFALVVFVWIFRKRLSDSATYTRQGRSFRRTVDPPYSGGGWWIGGGGFGGGGGSSNGGSDWGGGFGGGDFGGGGAGGDW
jgi:uncharacterized protein